MKNKTIKIVIFALTGSLLSSLATATSVQSFENNAVVLSSKIDQLLKQCAISNSKQSLYWNLPLQSSTVGLNWLKSSYALQLTTERVVHLDKTISSLPHSFQSVQILESILTELLLLKQVYRLQTKAVAFNVHNQCDNSLAKQVEERLKESYLMISTMHQQYSNTYTLMLNQANATLKVGKFRQQSGQVNVLFNQLNLN